MDRPRPPGLGAHPLPQVGDAPRAVRAPALRPAGRRAEPGGRGDPSAPPFRAAVPGGRGLAARARRGGRRRARRRARRNADPRRRARGRCRRRGRRAPRSDSPVRPPHVKV